MRIAILTPYSKPTFGGISSFVDGLGRTLRAKGHEVAVLSGEGEGDKPSHSNLGVGTTYSDCASSLISRLQPEVVHCQSHWAELEAGVRYKRVHPKARLVFSFHTTPKVRFGSPLSRLLRGADVVTFVSLDQMNKLRARLGLRGGLALLRPAVDLRAADGEAGRDWLSSRGITSGFPMLSFMGPLEYPRKVQGVIDLVASLPAVRSKFPSAQLMVIGDGSLRRRVANAATRHAVSVAITGFLDRPDAALAVTDIYCHISYQEGIPMALLEAMAAGCPVIASASGGIPEVLDGTNGLLVKPGPKPIVDAICHLAADEDMRRRMGRAARATVEKAFTWDRRLPEVQAAYGNGKAA